MPSVLDTPERLEEIDAPALPSAHPRFWRTWAPSRGWPHPQQSPRTPRSSAMTHLQKMETLLELMARQAPYLSIQAGASL